MDEIIEQYKELCNSGRAIDTKLWSIPTASFSIEAIAIQGYLKYTSPNAQLLISLLVFLVFTGLWFLFIRFRGYQIHVQNAIDELVKKNLPNFIHVHQFANLPKLPKNTFWLIRIVRFSSTNYLMIVMLVAILVDFALVIRSLLRIIHWV